MIHRIPIFFDADGTLIDTLSPHILFCRDLNEEFNLGLQLPDPLDIEACRNIAGTPMFEFFRKAGFPEDQIPKFVDIYRERFSKSEKYKAAPFPGIQSMLCNLRKNGNFLGLITSNIRENVETALGPTVIAIFNKVYDINDLRQYNNRKSDALKVAIWSELDIMDPRAVVFVGDTENDYRAAQEASTKFVGVSYGWEIRPDETRFPVFHDVSQLEKYLLSLK